ncbi:hypothetical protein [Tsuneonella troitsensis]|uniref:hypothetical protein n=1 Tax=Tsuneonella troitsensis TaxID=292222 RepID=UPI00070B5BD6|nr:hypothetical protein [Tsuneonella troitsensis]
MNKWNEKMPTAEQIEMTRRVETAIANEINLLAREGVPVACILTGLGLSIADLITCQAEASAVAPWFEKQAILVRTLQGDADNPN